MQLSAKLGPGSAAATRAQRGRRQRWRGGAGCTAVPGRLAVAVCRAGGLRLWAACRPTREQLLDAADRRPEALGLLRQGGPAPALRCGSPHAVSEQLTPAPLFSADEQPSGRPCCAAEDRPKVAFGSDAFEPDLVAHPLLRSGGSPLLQRCSHALPHVPLKHEPKWVARAAAGRTVVCWHALTAL